jgi:hypothetical protein
MEVVNQLQSQHESIEKSTFSIGDAYLAEIQKIISSLSVKTDSSNDLKNQPDSNLSKVSFENQLDDEIDQVDEGLNPDLKSIRVDSYHDNMLRMKLSNKKSQSDFQLI